MTDKIADFLTFYKNRSIDDVLLNPDRVMRDLDSIQDDIMRLNLPKDDDIYVLLQRIRLALQAHMVCLSEEISASKKTVVAANNSTRACIAYLGQAKLSRKEGAKS